MLRLISLHGRICNQIHALNCVHIHNIRVLLSESSSLAVSCRRTPKLLVCIRLALPRSFRLFISKTCKTNLTNHEPPSPPSLKRPPTKTHGRVWALVDIQNYSILKKYLFSIFKYLINQLNFISLCNDFEMVDFNSREIMYVKT